MVGLKSLKIPVNPCILLYGVCRRILLHRQRFTRRMAGKFLADIGVMRTQGFDKE